MESFDMVSLVEVQAGVYRTDMVWEVRGMVCVEVDPYEWSVDPCSVPAHFFWHMFRRSGGYSGYTYLTSRKASADRLH